MSATSDLPLLGTLAHAQGLVTQLQLEEAIRIKEESAQKGRHRYLGDILVELAGVEPDEIVDVLRVQGKAIVRCDKCGDQYNASLEDTFTCPRCGRGLIEVIGAESVAVRATLAKENRVHMGTAELREEIHRGPHSSLYRADGNRTVKLLPLEGPNKLLAGRFFGNVKTVAAVEDDCVARIFDHGTRATTLYITREYVEGVHLQALVGDGGRLPEDEAVSLLRGITRGLAAIHGKMAVHGNLKAENVIVTSNMGVKLTDGGLRRDHPQIIQKLPAFLGSAVHVMAPEQWLGLPIDVRTDLYAAGVLFYLMLTGEYPIRDNFAHNHVKVSAPSPRSVVADVPVGVAAIARKLLIKDPKRRYANTTALLKDLDLVEQGKPPEALDMFVRKVKCSFCEALQPSTATKCAVCKEPMGEMAELELRLD